MSKVTSIAPLQEKRSPEDFLNPVVVNMPPSGIRRFFDLVANMKGVISLGVGEPDFVTPWRIRESAWYSLEKGMTMYTSNWGMPELRKEIAGYMKNSFDLEYNWEEQILITVGASEAVDLAMRAILTPGDEMLIPEPCYVSYKPTAELTGAVGVTIPTYVEDDFRLTADTLRKYITPKTKMLILCYPNNPTGAYMSREDMLDIAKLVEEFDLMVISDEIYAELTYEGTHTSFASLPGMMDRTIVLNGFSKAFAMTGWRIGYACGHPAILGAMTKIHQYTMLCAPIMGQVAALEALRKGMGEKDKMVNQYNQRRRLVVQRFNEMGLDCFEPKGAFYAFPSIKKTGMTSEEFCEKLLQEEKVAVVPGTAFGESGDGFIRVSYAASIQQITEALNRIEAFVNRHK